MFIYNSETIYLTPTTQKVCVYCKSLIKDLRDHLVCNLKGRGADNPSTPIEGVANNTASTTLTHSDPSVTL